MTARVDASSFTAAARRLNRASGRLQKELVDNLHAAAPRIEAGMHAAASTPIQQHAASTVRIERIGDGITVHGGGGGGPGGVLFAGGEFGGRKAKKRTYATRSPAGRAYVVQRRTTMQFLAHRGRVGYFYYPTLREQLPRLLEEQKATLERLAGGR
jgi:hypothetical protein